jgi:ectoine hydroxylase-related dioxygenase (phytanoyl-CoA dioxygenase family)
MPKDVMFADDGYLIVSGLVSTEVCRELIHASETLFSSGAGTRGWLARPEIASLARVIATDPRIAAHLPEDAVAIQCTFFRKDAGTNWFVPWHQDTAMPCRYGVGDINASRWSVKEGEDFVECPADVLESLVAVRLALDDNSIENGPLRVRPGSHSLGVLTEADIESVQTAPVDCCVAAGGAVLIKPLLIHSSRRSHTSQPRRVLHFLFGPRRPARGLVWNLAVG